MYKLTWAAVVFANFLVLSPTSAQVTDCDRLAANPPDPDRVADGVPRANVDILLALAACHDAIESEPESARAAYQLGRVYFYDGNTTLALKYIGQAADRGYRQAEFIMGALIKNRREGVPYDICKVEEFWLRSARAGHLHARVSYVRLATKGEFAACPTQAGNDQLQSFISIEVTGSANYFLRLLVADLSEDVAILKQEQGQK